MTDPADEEQTSHLLIQALDGQRVSLERNCDCGRKLKVHVQPPGGGTAIAEERLAAREHIRQLRGVLAMLANRVRAGAAVGSPLAQVTAADLDKIVAASINELPDLAERP